MRVSLFVVIAALLFAGSALAETTPLSETVPDEKDTFITCELTQAPRFSEVPVFKSQAEAENTKGTYHYKVWLPKGYSADPQKRWPCMFIMASGGNAGMASMKDYLKSNGYIVVMLQEAKNGPWEPIVGNFLAAHDAVVARFRIQEGKKYATGQSGGARGSSVFVQIRPGFCGLIMQSAGASITGPSRYNVSGINRNPNLYVAMTMGASDKNQPEVDQMKRVIPAQHFASFEFDGGHVWAPADVFEKAMTWVNSKAAGGGSTGTATGGTADPSFDDFFKKK